MNVDEVLMMAQNAIMITFYLSMPIIGVATGVGLVVALLQTLIQLQEQTLGFAAKLTAVVIMLSLSAGWMANQLMIFLDRILTQIAGI